MAGYINTIPIGAPIAPKDTRHRYPTHKDIFGYGGYRVVDTLIERDAIPLERKKEGMLVYVIENLKTYILKNSVWEEVKVKLVVESADASVSFSDINTLKIDTDTGLNFYSDSDGSVTLATQKAFTRISDGTNDLFGYDNQSINLVETPTVKPSIAGNNISFQTKTYSYSSTMPSVVHVVPHNLNTNILICNIYTQNIDGSLDFVVVPYTIRDLNTIEIHFTTAKDIKVNVIPLEPI